MHNDSYQVTYEEGNSPFGFLIFDDLRAVQTGAPTSTQEENSEIPDKITLQQNYPNPFNPSTNIQFGLPETQRVTISVYDMLGREVAVVFDGIKSQGYHTVNFDAAALSSGVYLYRLTTGNNSIVKKMTLVK